MRKIFIIISLLCVVGCIPAAMKDMFNNNQQTMKTLAEAPEEKIAGSASTIKDNAKKVDAKMQEIRLLYDIPYEPKFEEGNTEDDFLSIDYDVSWITAKKDETISFLINLIIGLTTGGISLGTALALGGKYLLSRKNNIISNIINGGLRIREAVKSGKAVDENSIKEMYLSEQKDEYKDEIEKLVDKEKAKTV